MGFFNIFPSLQKIWNFLTFTDMAKGMNSKKTEKKEATKTPKEKKDAKKEKKNKSSYWSI